MSNIREARSALLRRILEGAGTASSSDRRAAFDLSVLTGPLAVLVNKVVWHPSTVTDGDVAAAKAAGFTENQIFEISVCAAIGQANRQYEAALAALDAATRKE